MKILAIVLSVSMSSLTVASAGVQMNHDADNFDMVQGVRILQEGLDAFLESVGKNPDLRRDELLRREGASFRKNVRELKDAFVHSSESRRDNQDPQDLWEELSANYLSLRRDFHSVRWDVQDGPLNAWYRLVFAFENLNLILRSGDQGEQLGLKFRGSLGNLEVEFSAANYQGLQRDCESFVNQNNISASSMKIFDKSLYFGLDSYAGAALCTIVALNARVEDDNKWIAVGGKFGSIPFKIYASNLRKLRKLLDRVFVGLEGRTASTFEIGGANYYTGLESYGVKVFAALIKFNIDEPQKPMIAKGKLGSLPALFAGYSADEIETSCLSYFESVYGSGSISSLTINGKSQYAGLETWNASKSCMMVKTMARLRTP